MRSRESQSSDCRIRKQAINAAALVLISIIAMAAAFLYAARNSLPGLTDLFPGHGGASAFADLPAVCGRTLTLTDPETGREYAAWPMEPGDTFSVGFIHSVNKSPVTDYYELRDDGIYVVKTVYYGFGAGVQTELEEGQTLTYGDDGSMIITGFDRRMDDLIYFVGTVSDHTLTLNEETEISLRDLCGRNAMVRFSFS